MKNLREAYQAHLMPNYKPQDLVLAKGSGASVIDEDGRTYIDFTSGIGVNALGFCDDEWIQAVVSQLETLQHASNLYLTAPAIRLAEKLADVSPFSAALFVNSGAEANESAIKLARKYSYDRYGEGRHEIITMVDSFHGRTLGTLAATGQTAMHPTFAPLAPGFRYVPAGDINALRRAVGPATCAVMVECVQGEGGVNVLDKSYLQAAATLCRENDLLLISDEVQTGIGRTGKLFAFEHAGIVPDIATLAKGLGAGLPIGCCLATERVKDVLGPGSHGSTFGGNPAICAGALVVLERISHPAFMDKINAKAALFSSLLEDIEGIAEISQLGLMMGLRLKDKTPAQVLARAQELGLLVLTAKDKIRLLPPLNISEQDIQEGLALLKTAIDE